MKKEIKLIDKSLDNVFVQSNSLKKFWKDLNEHFEVYVLGGFLRAHLSNKEFRDVDFIVTSKNNDIINFLDTNEIRFKKNRFDGFKINISNIKIDLWSINDHFYYKNNYLTSKNDIAKSCFLNFDSLVYNYTHKILYDEHYKKAVNNNIIDFVVQDDDYIYTNPGKENNILKMFVLKNKYNIELSKKIREYIKYYCENEKDNVNKIYSTQLSHYGEYLLSKKQIKVYLNSAGL